MKQQGIAKDDEGVARKKTRYGGIAALAEQSRVATSLNNACIMTQRTAPRKLKTRGAAPSRKRRSRVSEMARHVWRRDMPRAYQ